MQIHLESADVFAVQSYDETQITSNGQSYQHNLILCKRGILTEWPIESITHLENNVLDVLQDGMGTTPEIILIGHCQTGKMAPINSRILLSKEKIGFESMSIGAACRTYNVLLSEGREVVLGIIFGLSKSL